jgi:hypothetical protein
VFVGRLMWLGIPSLAVARNRVCVVRAQSEPVRDVHSACFAKDAAEPVRVVRDVDEPSVLESVFKILLVQCS